MISVPEYMCNERSTNIAIVALNAAQLQILLTQHAREGEQSPRSWSLPCVPMASEGEEKQAVQRWLNTEMGGDARILQVECMGTFFHDSLLAGEIQLVFLALMEKDTPRNGGVWWRLDALPEVAEHHVATVVYAVKTLIFKLAHTHDVLALLPKSLTLQDVGLLVTGLNRSVRRHDADGKQRI